VCTLPPIWRQYLHVCTSTASKLSTCPRPLPRKRAAFPGGESIIITIPTARCVVRLCSHRHAWVVQRHLLPASGVSICTFVLCQHTSAYVSIRLVVQRHLLPASGVSICTFVLCQHTSAYVSIRQHTSGWYSDTFGQLQASVFVLLYW
jgi:hypothetical protein